jgi:hypothetical protein
LEKILTGLDWCQTCPISLKNIFKWKNKWEVWIGPPKCLDFGPPLGFTNLPTRWT